MSDLPIITAVICTRDKAYFLDKCIQSLLRQSLDREKYEILVVDNGSTDETADVLKRYNQAPMLRSVYEPVVGLSRARNTGWREASGRYVGYIDDDAAAEEGWLESALWCFENLYPMPDWVGGPISLDWEIASSDWINVELSVPLGKVYWGDEPCRLTNHQRLGGGNSFFLKRRLKELGGFEERLGRKYGSRFMGQDAHRVVYFWHMLGNRFLTTLSNMFTNITLTDMETCYKAFKGDLIRSIPIEENRFGFEPEITAKIVKRKCRIYEVDISYYGRTYDERKKINWKDGLSAIRCIFKYNLFRK